MGGILESGAQKKEDIALQATTAEQQAQLETQNRSIQQQRVLALRRSIGGGGTMGAAQSLGPTGPATPQQRGLGGLGGRLTSGLFTRSRLLG